MAALEFCLPPEDATTLLRLPGLGRGARPVTSDRVWYDTADGVLTEAGLSVCEHKGMWRIERSRPAARELWPPGGPAPLLAEAASLEALGDARAGLPLPLMPVAGFRGRHRVVPASGTTLTVLEGTLRGVTQERPVCRVIMQGLPASLLAVSNQAAGAVRLSVPLWSLAAEAVALARGEEPPPRHEGAPDVGPGTSLSDAIAIVLGHLADVILAAAPFAGGGRSSEPVHQMRVAVRRLRSALSVFRHDTHGPAFDALTAGLKQLASALGAARDWDVFLEGTGASVAAALPGDPRIAAMLAAGSRHRMAAYADLRTTLASAEIRQLGVALAQIAALRPWEDDPERAEPLQGKVEAFATRWLDHRRDRILAPGATLDGLSTEELHSLRKKGKRLRYACEFFAPLYGRKAPRRFIARLSALQDALGHLNDTASAGALMAALGGGSGRQFAAGAVQGYVAARAEAARGDIRRAWAKFRRQRPFWA